MEGIQVSVEKTGSRGDISIIKVGGYIDTTTSAELERALDTLLKSGVFRIIIDLRNVDYISSAGWGIFISEIKGIRERGGDLKLANMIPDVYEVFELLEFHYILKAYDSVSAAMQDFEGGLKGGAVITEHKAVPDPDSETFNPDDEDDEPSVPQALEEKIRQIALEHPSWNHGQISKELNTAKFGFERVGKLTVWKLLRKMHLQSKKNREEIANRSGSNSTE